MEAIPWALAGLKNTERHVDRQVVQIIAASSFDHDQNPWLMARIKDLRTCQFGVSRFARY